MGGGSTSTNCNDRDNVMAICPECFSSEKAFFASRCEECNQPIGFIRQSVFQILWTTVYVTTIVLAFSFVLYLISG